jgi:pteridine reductase
LPVAIVTGGAKRLGKAMVLALVARGYDVVIHCNQSASEAVELQREIQNQGRSAWVVSADLSQADLSGFFSAVLALEQPIQLLVNSASVFIPSTFEQSDAALLDLHWQVNCRAPYLLSQWFAQQFSSGHIVNLTDCIEHNARYFPYMLSKNALVALTKMLAKDLAPKIRVNAIAPGWILDPPGDDAKTFPADAVCSTIPAGFKGKEEDICQALIYLQENEYIYGQTIYVDGGRHL